MGYSVGFLVVVLGRQQLFTENTITPILPLLHDRSIKTAWRVARLWVVVLVGNLRAHSPSRPSSPRPAPSSRRC